MDDEGFGRGKRLMSVDGGGCRLSSKRGVWLGDILACFAKEFFH